ncbi:Orotidine 5'-phosphate decarboxylase {ECO:0000255/HAMAP-Rule:MF_01200} [Oenococcus sicerae]|nr:Orotidine 5'-phosphate decarboxylase {ECO:0000255/HAMAP-Rule:MF_01200} [Oenococcus sicerae]
MTKMTDNLFIALDFTAGGQALDFLKHFKGIRPAVKVGMALFYAAGADFIHELRQEGYPVFLDLKLFDIPNTVAASMISINRLDVQFLTLHALGGQKMLAAAVQEKAENLKLLAVTQLTSFSETEMQQTQMTTVQVGKSVQHLAKIAESAGMDGTISSAQEADLIQQVTGPNFLKVTPGIRLADGQRDDQSRIATPAYAKDHGANALVIGRPITQAADPLAVYKKILEDFT